MNFGHSKTSLSFSDLQLSGSVTMYRLLNLLEPQISYLKEGDNLIS